jgi:drug/metabolite transporter (DMT)-like permease
VAVALALVAAVTYGVSDFVGGLASRRERAVLVLLMSYPVGMLLQATLLPLLPGRLDAPTLGWGAAAGLAGAAGVVLLYLGLASGPMSVVAPLTAVSSAVVPAGAGIALGERPPPAAYAGVLLALAAVALVSRSPGSPETVRAADGRPGRVGGRPVLLALLAGAGFGAYFVLVARAGSGSGLWPLVVSRSVASVAMVVLALAAGALARPAAGVVPLALVSGALDAAANLAYLVAVRHGMLALVAVLVALYPAATVTLATAVLGERTGAAQRLGLVVAGASVALIALTS